MLKRLCPVCDGEMKTGHFCPVCRQWIREPKMVNVTYYLNERHPKGETDCLYHNELKEIINPPKKPERQPKKNQGMKKEPARKAAVSGKKQGGKGYRAVWIVLAVYLVIMFFVPVVKLLMTVLNALFFFL